MLYFLLFSILFIQVVLVYLMLINEIFITKKEFYLCIIPVFGITGLLVYIIINMIVEKYPIKELFIENYKKLI